MNNILIIGAGRSSTALIKYLLEKSEQHDWSVVVADANLELAEEKVGKHPNGQSVLLDVMNEGARNQLVEAADVVVSMLPARLHFEVAKDCIRFKKHLITASYISKEMQSLDAEAKKAGLIFMGEIGLDPGIDHMSAVQKIDEIKDGGAKMTAFRSYTGGLIAPESDDNPWHYKFTWNPRNVVLSGQGTAQYLENNKYKYIPYNRLFGQHKTIEVPEMGTYEVYANRDSLTYREIYGLTEIPNILRGTIRNMGYCDAWDALLKIGLTDDSYQILESAELTYNDFMEAFLEPRNGHTGTVKERVAEFLGEETNSVIMEKLDWLGLFSDQKIGLKSASPALILEKLLLKKWTLKPDDKDMIIMQHEFEYELDGKKKLLTSTLVSKGKDSVYTAMARLVGIPLGIFVRLVMLGKVNVTGVNIPVMRQVYEPVLEELKEYGVVFVEKIKVVG